MAEKRFLDKTGLAYVWTRIQLALSGKVDKETGKGLSEANFTQAEKTKLANIANGAEVNVNADWNAVTGDAAILNKPTNIVQDPDYVHITVDSTMSDSSSNPIANETVKGYIDDAIGSVTGVQFQKVASYADLPQPGSNGVIYLVPIGGTGTNTYEEYIWINKGTDQAPNYGYEKIGTTDVDLSQYQLSAELIGLTNSDIDDATDGGQ